MLFTKPLTAADFKILAFNRHANINSIPDISTVFDPDDGADMFL
jgi:hypothetical protein